MATTWKRELTAFHEAGHVVVAVHRGGLFVGADLVLRLEEGSQARTYGAGVRGIQVCLAGIAAAQIRRGHGDRPFPWTTRGGQGDIRKALALLRAGESPWVKIPEVYASTARLLRRRWPDVERVAGALLEWGTLTDGMVADVLAGRGLPPRLPLVRSRRAGR